MIGDKTGTIYVLYYIILYLEIHFRAVPRVVDNEDKSTPVYYFFIVMAMM